jgi:hypothetical protein
MAGSLENRGKLRELIDKFKFAELTKIKPVRKMTFLRTGFCVAFSNDIYLFCN